MDEQSPTLTSDWHQPAYLSFVGEHGGNTGFGICDDMAPVVSAKHAPSVMAFDTTQITNPDNNAHPEFGKPCHTLNANAHVPTICLQTDHMEQNGTNTSVDVCKTLDVASATPVVCVSDDQAHSAVDVDVSGTLKVGGGVP